MDYQLENLGPEKFQEFCQALLVKEYPGLQCIPIGQPDGGIDASVKVDVPEEGKFLVFQIKFVRNPYKMDAPHKWLHETLEGEVAKIEKIIPKGAEKYILITNVKGTAHPEVGSIDKVNKILEERISIKSQCYWREDVNRRLDGLWDIKMVYPEVMTGPDIMRYMISQVSKKDQDRIEMVSKAFLREQLSHDEHIKFKQVELKTNIFGLYIDLQIFLIGPKRWHGDTIRKYYYGNADRKISGYDDASYGYENETRYNYSVVGSGIASKNMGAASFLLEAKATHMKRTKYRKLEQNIVLEGAPGQGKSTVVQYVCQVLRYKLLNEKLDGIYNYHKASPVRYPIKAEVRDFSKWLAKQNPFDPETPVPPNSYKSLEGFLAFMISHYSGGARFNIEDLMSMLKKTPAIIVLDGLDEVADISTRNIVVDEIVKGVDRLRENAKRLKVVVTSRPSSFTNSPGLPPNKFTYVHLDDVNDSQVFEYMHKWVVAEGINQVEIDEMKNILTNKIKETHFKELTTNPMQLAILLSLIHTRGASLPDKRTALYDSYIELFFNREAEKSAIVRRHRDLLINIHRYLGWVLHSESELRPEGGSIQEDTLHSLLEHYLDAEGYDKSLAKTLFKGMVERVVAIVARSEGLYEFEVQPLREYFAARYLYETAPYSSAGNEKNGTLPERFEALVKNLYWLNVSRFLAGCYSVGELDSLYDCLQIIATDDSYKYLSYPYKLSYILLADWVFTQRPRNIPKIIDMICSSSILAINRKFNPYYSRGSMPSLSKDCGRDIFINKQIDFINNGNIIEHNYSAYCAIRSQGLNENVRMKILNNIMEGDAERQNKWINILPKTDILESVSNDSIQVLYDNVQPKKELIEAIAKGFYTDFIESNEEHYKYSVDIFLSCETRAYILVINYNTISWMRVVTDLNFYREIYSNYSGDHMTGYFDRNKDAYNLNELIDGYSMDSGKLKDEMPTKYKAVKFLKKCNRYFKRGRRLFSASLEPWDQIVKAGFELFGEKWAFVQLANLSAGVKLKNEKCLGYNNLFDHDKSLVKRIRYARMRSGKWWAKTLESAKNNYDNMLAICVLVTYGGEKTLLYNYDILNKNICDLKDVNFVKMYNCLMWTCGVLREWGRIKTIRLTTIFHDKDIFGRFFNLLWHRMKNYEWKEYINHINTNYKEMDLCSLINSFGMVRWAGVKKVINKNDLLAFTRYYYQKLNNPQIALTPDSFLGKSNYGPNVKQSIEILKRPDSYPDFLTEIAEHKYQEYVTKNVVPVAEVAKRGNWFTLR